MAEEESPAPEEEGGKGGKKGLIIMIVVVLLAIGGSVAGTLFFVGGAAEPEPVAQEEVDVTPPAVYHEMRPAFIVNYITTNKPRYLQTELSVMSRESQAIEAVIDHMPLVRSTILDTLNRAEFESLRTNSGKQALLEELALEINNVLTEEIGEAKIETVLFTNFVLQ
ncbi:MAG: flagellar basal body-associated FliL family protein [Pseudomonadota bacterium]